MNSSSSTCQLAHRCLYMRPLRNHYRVPHLPSATLDNCRFNASQAQRICGLAFLSTCHLKRSSDHSHLPSYIYSFVHPSKSCISGYRTFRCNRHSGNRYPVEEFDMKFNLSGTVGQHGRSTGKERKWKIFWTYSGDWVLTVFLWVSLSICS